MKPRAKYLLRAVFSILLFWVALNQVEWSQVREVLSRAIPIWILLHLLSLLLERIVFSYKWQILLDVKMVSVSLWTLLRITMIGKFWGIFLPSSVGVDVLRGYYLYRQIFRGATAASSILVDKVMSLWALLLMGSIGLLTYGQVMDGPGALIALIGLLFSTALVLYVIQNDKVAVWVERRLPMVFGQRLGEIGMRVYRSFLGYKQYPGILAKSLFYSVIMQFVRVLGVFTMAHALYIEIPILYYLILIPVGMILIMLPISIGGFGLREGIFVGLFAVAGMSTSDAFALGLATSLTDLLVSLLGGLVYIIDSPATAVR